jgi:hypothetical protein
MSFGIQFQNRQIKHDQYHFVPGDFGNHIDSDGTFVHLVCLANLATQTERFQRSRFLFPEKRHLSQAGRGRREASGEGCLFDY